MGRPTSNTTLQYVTLLTILKIVQHQKAAGVVCVFTAHDIRKVLNFLGANCANIEISSVSSVAIVSILLSLAEITENVRIMVECGGVQLLMCLLDKYPPHPNLVDCFDKLQGVCSLRRDRQWARRAYI